MAGFGGFGSSGFGAPSSPSPFGQSAPAFGGAAPSPFGAQQASSPFGVSPAAGAFGQQSAPAFGASPAPAFGGSAFGAAPAAGGFGAQAGFGAKPAGSGFGTFGATSNATPFGAASASAFGASSTPAFGAASTSAFGAAANPSPFGSQLMTQPAFGAASAPTGFGSAAATPAFGGTQPGFGGTPGFGAPQSGATGTRGIAYQKTQEQDSSSSGVQRVSYVSINAMAQYSSKSLEELRWEDYQAGCKGNTGAGAASPFGASSGFGGPAASPFGGTSAASPFGASQPSPFGGGSSAPAFGAAATSAFGSSSTPTFGAGGSSPFGASSTPAFGAAQPATQFGAMSAPAFGSSPFGASATPAFGANTASGFGAQSTPAFGGSSAPAFGASPAPAFGAASTPVFGASTGAFGAGGGSSLFGASAPATAQQGLASSSPFGASPAPAFGAAPSAFGMATSTPAFGGGGMFGANPASASSLFGGASTPSFGGLQPATGGGFFGAAATQSAFGAGTPTLGGAFGQSSPSLFGGASAFNKSPGNPALPLAGGAFGFTQPVSSPFGAHPMAPQAATPPGIAQSPYGALPQAPTIGDGTPTPAMKVGISQRPIGGASGLAATSIITPRTITPRSGVRSRPRRVSTAAHRAQTAASSPALMLCNNVSSPAGSLFAPRENPRRLFIREAPPSTSMSTARGNGHSHTSHRAQPADTSRSSPPLASPVTPQANGIASLPQPILGTNGNGSDHTDIDKDIISQLPVLRRGDYYTEPSLDALKSRVKADSGALGKVHGFTVGRSGFGSVTWVQPVDIRGLDLDVLVQIRFKELEVYPEGVDKPDIGKGLNGPATITLQKVFKMDKSTGKPTTDEAAIKKFRRRLIEHTAQMQSKFVSYDPDTGEWIFQVAHFSKYGLDDSDDDSDDPADQGSDDDMQLLGVASLIPPRMPSSQTAPAPGELGADGEDADMQVAEPNELHVTRSLIAELGDSSDMAAEDGEETADELEVTIGDSGQGLLSRPVAGTLSSAALPHSLPAALQLEASELADMQMGLELPGMGRVGRRGSAARLWQGESNALSSAHPRGIRHSWVSSGSALGDPQSEWDATSASIISLPSPQMPRQIVDGTENMIMGNLTATAMHDMHTSPDTALMLGKSFRVGWGPNGTLAVPYISSPSSNASSPHAGVCMENVATRCNHLKRPEDPAEIVGRTRNRLVEALSAHSHYSSSVPGGISPHPVAPARVLTCQRERSSLSDVCNAFNQVAIESHGSAVSQLEKIIAAHEMGAWQLVLELFSSIDVADVNGDTQQLEPLRRRAAVSDLLRQLTRSTVQAAVSSAPDLEAVVMAWLTGHEVGCAMGAAASAGDVRLATLIAAVSAQGGAALHEPLRAQLDIWSTEQIDSNIYTRRLALYNLFSGQVSKAAAQLGLDWRRSLGLYLWYGLAPTSSLCDVLEAFQTDSRDGRAAKPQPVYTGSTDSLSGHSLSDDTWFALICLEAGSSHCATELSLERLLHPSGHTPDPFDHTFVWQLAGVLLGLDELQTLGASQGSSQYPDVLYRLTAAVIAHAEFLGEPLWAIYAACHIPDHPLVPGMRERVVKDLLARHACSLLVDNPSDVETRLCDELQLPQIWLAEAKALWAKYTWQNDMEAQELLSSEQWAPAHDIIVLHVAPKLFLSGKHEALSTLLVQLQIHAAEIDGWEHGAGLFAEFYHLQQCASGGSNSGTQGKAAFLGTAVSQAASTGQFQAADGRSLYACLARMAHNCRAWAMKSHEVPTSSSVLGAQELVSCRPPLSLHQQSLHTQYAAASIFRNLTAQ